MNITCASGVHLRVLSGAGAMRDGLICVDCGRDKYPEVFGTAVHVRCWPGTIDRTPEGRRAAWYAAGGQSCYQDHASQECLGCINKERCDEEWPRYQQLMDATLGGRVDAVRAQWQLFLGDLRAGITRPIDSVDIAVGVAYLCLCLTLMLIAAYG